MTYQNKKIGILGGSFDPIHNGHLAIAESAYQDFNLDEIWLIPAGHSPNKDEYKMTSAIVRAEMTALAVQNIPYFKLICALACPLAYNPVTVPLPKNNPFLNEPLARTELNMLERYTN